MNTRTLSYSAGRLALVTCGLLIPVVTWASKSEHHEETTSVISLGTVVMLALGLGLAYPLAHWVMDWLQRRFLVFTGVEYIAIGVVLGSQVADIPAFHEPHPLAPLFALAAGWIGFIYGMTLNLRTLLDARDGSMRVALLEGLCTVIPVTLAAHALFTSQWLGLEEENAWLSAAVLGCTAWAGSDSALRLISEQYRTDGSLTHLLRRTSQLGDLCAIAIFGMLFCAFRSDIPAPEIGRSPTEWEWGLLTVAIGVGLGGLFTFFLDDKDSPNDRFLALVGIICFATGAAFYLRLSPLFITLLLGVVLVNTYSHAEDVSETLISTVRPMRLVLLVFAGALWEPAPLLPTLAAIVGYMVLRSIGKGLGGALAALGGRVRADIARGLFAQGSVTLAMAMSFKLVYEGTAVNIAYSTILVSMLIHELVAPRILKGLLVDAGEIHREARFGS